ncbi:MAG: YtxH domain-containing protein [Saprospiraceae bacterium]|jgi:gas vesicle protein
MSTLKYVGAIAGGMLVGAALGVLFAPCSGKETRNLLARRSNKAQEDLKGMVNSGINAWKDKYRQTFNPSNINGEFINELFSDIKAYFAQGRADIDFDQLVSEGKKEWYKTNNMIREGADLTADQVDDLLNTIFNKGEAWFKKFSSNLNDMADNVKDDMHDVSIDTKTQVNNTNNNDNGFI